MANETITMLAKVKESAIWTATMSYYIYYYSLYSLMMRLGVKCEIHSCSIEFMKRGLLKFYDHEDTAGFEEAFNTRIDLQYYSDRAVNTMTSSPP